MKKTVVLIAKHCLALIVVLFISPSLFAGDDQVACLDPEGRPVDYWVAIKPPGTLEDYFYRDSNSSRCLPQSNGSCFAEPKGSLSDARDGPLARTLQQIYLKSNSSKTSHLMYNDDAPYSVFMTSQAEFAHSKGVLAIGKFGGFWLMHSLPRFPMDKVGKGYRGLSQNGKVNGQVFFCLSLEMPQVRIVGKQLNLSRPNIYEKSGFSNEIRNILGSSFDGLLDGNEGEAISEMSRAVDISVKPDLRVISFSKSNFWGEDFYDDLIAPFFEADLLVNSWTNGQGTLPTFCAGETCQMTRFRDRRNVCLPSCATNPHECVFDFNVQNIKSIRFDETNAWINSKDHSKWAVSTKASKVHVFCVGDINRQRGQRRRGGGAICLEDENLWQAFHNLIEAADTCPR